ncbi:YdiU family protein [Sansalvadorimonas sp. 2012CJ34-2]|uniref:Protein nucleotidyltransferase YdiU n=1 Tax=Parendozoicomonas callyspongiae TaxID=2942213 RepID=A0ABT0PIL1_9GAMM|nr:YdiU family protein [Sansalvadorimonas sp. 2012CJ34-2]MCL6271195.1 YdiU family protein [Sansalvadorimonas sp. 2012CJ34-2]
MKLVHTYADLGSTFSSHVQPQPLDTPELVSVNQDIVQLLSCADFSEEQLAQLCNGEMIPEGGQPVSMVYSGHQFGVYVPRLGDGRAILLGETEGSDGVLYDLQLKGAGLTPYSRDGDGRAVLRSTIREYLCGEALHSLGIPTTRALCLINSNTPVYREQVETGAALLRVSESHIRFGTFEYFSHTRQLDALSQLVDYVVERHFPEWTDADDKAANLLSEATRRTAEMVAQWQAVGWCHGVMNSDNMSILGHTIDYGPFGFIDGFNAVHICNHSDWHGRYAFNRQPDIGYWNCSALASALLPLLEGKEQAEDLIKQYPSFFSKKYASLLRAKFGLSSSKEGDSQLFDEVFQLMHDERTDYTIFFRALGKPDLQDLFIDRDRFNSWSNKYEKRIAQEPSSLDEIIKSMSQVNPKYILRNHLLQIAINKAENGDYSEVNKLLKIIRQPFSEQPEFESYADSPPDWAGDLEVSCSS